MVRSLRATLILGNNVVFHPLRLNKIQFSKSVIRSISSSQPCNEGFNNVVAKALIPSMRIGVQGAPFDRGQVKKLAYFFFI